MPDASLRMRLFARSAINNEPTVAPSVSASTSYGAFRSPGEMSANPAEPGMPATVATTQLTPDADGLGDTDGDTDADKPPLADGVGVGVGDGVGHTYARIALFWLSAK